MITELTIQNFKMFENLTVSGLSRLNLIGGKHGTGKSTLLESLFLSANANPHALIQQIALRGMKNISATEQDLWHPFFYNFNYKQPIIISSKTDDKSNPSLEIQIKPIQNLQQSISSGQIKQDILSIFQAKEFHEMHMIFQNHGKKRVIKQYFMNNQLNYNADNPNFIVQEIAIVTSQREDFNAITENYNEISKNNDEDKLVKIVNDILHLDVQKFDILAKDNMPVLYVQTKSLARKLPIHLMAEGLQHIFQIISYIISKKCKILLIDEIENGLHYSVLPKLWAVLEKLADDYDMQIFATTHDEESIKVFADLKEENRSYIRLGHTREGKIKATTIKDNLVSFLETGFEAR